MTTLKCLLALELLEVSDRYLYELREAHKNADEVFDLLPEYTINTNETANNCPIHARYFHQFVGMSENEEPRKSLYFNLSAIDRQLDYEISQSGIEDLFKEFDFVKILSNFTPQNEKDFEKHAFLHTHYLIVELTYNTYYDNYSGATEGDMEIDITGYLNDNLQSIFFNN